MIILLNGPPRCGKNVVGSILFASHSFRTRSLAEPIKESAHRLFGLHVHADYFESQKDEPRVEFGGLTPRSVYITVGRFAVRKFGQEHFVRTLLAKRPPDERTVVTDLGFEHEVEAFRRLCAGVKVIRIIRPGTDFSNDSRQYVRNPDYVLTNDGMIDDLKQKVKEMYEQLQR